MEIIKSLYHTFECGEDCFIGLAIIILVCSLLSFLGTILLRYKKISKLLSGLELLVILGATLAVCMNHICTVTFTISGIAFVFAMVNFLLSVVFYDERKGPIKVIKVEKPVEVIKEVEKPVEVVKEVEVIKEVEKPVEVVKEVEKPVEVVKEVIVEKPVEVVKEVIVEKPVEVIKEVIVEKPVEVEQPKAPKEPAEEKAPKLTMMEEYEALPKEYKKYFDKIKKYGANLKDVKMRESKSCLTFKLKKSLLFKLEIKNGVVQIKINLQDKSFLMANIDMKDELEETLSTLRARDDSQLNMCINAIQFRMSVINED